MNKEEKVYNIQVTEKQLRILSATCNAYMRLICGQSMDLAELMESAWEKHCKKATDKMIDEEWNGGWSKAREDAETYAQAIRDRFWFCKPGSLYGLGYDETADMLYDIHQVLRHQLYLDLPENERAEMKWTVLADPPMQFGKEPLPVVTRKENKEKIK